MDYTNLNLNKKAYIFELDDVLYPQQDYLLQVYYLFANLLEYTENEPSAESLMEYFKREYQQEKASNLFEKAAVHFNIDQKHEASFKSLHVNAKLPLKLLLYKEVLSLLAFLIGEGKSVFVLTAGNPLMQLNKLKQMEWNGLDQFIKAYFYDEIALKTELEPIEYVLKENNILPSEALCFYAPIDNEKEMKRFAGIDHIDINLFIK